MSSQILSIEQLLKLEVGTVIYFIQNDQLRHARFVGQYPTKSPDLKIGIFADGSMMFQFGESYFKYKDQAVFTDHDEAGLNYVKHYQKRADGVCYIYTPDHETDSNGTIHPLWINRKIREPEPEQCVFWTHFPVCDTTMEFASMSDSDFDILDIEFNGVKWLTHWREVNNEFYYIKQGK